jgi:hypothetical protein
LESTDAQNTCETSSNVPVFRGDEIKDGIKRLVKQEVDRIRLIKSEIETFMMFTQDSI